MRLLEAALFLLTSRLAQPAVQDDSWADNPVARQNLVQPLPARIAHWSIVAEIPVSTNNANWTGYANSTAADWVIQLPDYYSSNACRDYGKGPWPGNSYVKWTGNPSEGGVAVVIFRATQWELHEFLKSRMGAIQVEEDVIATKFTPQELNPAIWGLDRIDAQEGLDNGYDNNDLTGKGVHVYVADTGIRTTHDQFEGRAIPTLEILDNGLIECNGDVNCAVDNDGHGTHCAGTIGGKQFGVAKEAVLHAVKVLGDDGSGSFASFVQAIDFVSSRGQRPAVISASLGGRGTLRFVNNALNRATARGVTVVVAAGNEGSSDLPDACFYTPAGVPSAITVGSIGQPRFNDVRSAFSNIGSCVDIFAPGGLIPSCGIQSDNDVAFLSGTSMACPHVTGASALLLGQNPSRTPSEVRSILVNKATDNRISDVGEGSPNKLLFTGSFADNIVTPSPTFSESSFVAISNGTCGDIGLFSIPIESTCDAAGSALSKSSRLPVSGSVAGCFVTDEPSGTGTTQEICTSLVPQFQQITSGTCSAIGMFPITLKSVCEDAANSLGIVPVIQETAFTPAPEGCFVFQATSVFLSINPENAGNGASLLSNVEPLVPICISFVEAAADADPDGPISGSPSGLSVASALLFILINGILQTWRA